MLVPRLVVRIVSVGITVLGASVVGGQEYPNKPLRIVASPPGGATDFVARVIAQGLSSRLGQPVIIDNRPSALTGEIAAKLPADGYNLLSTASNFWILPLVRKTDYDPLRDFSAITLLSRSPNILVVHPSLPVKSVKELIALAKARPGELNYLAAETGSVQQIGGELFKSMAGVNIVGITYKSAGAGNVGLLGGEVQISFAASPASITSHLQAGRLRALAVGSLQPSALFPELPTVSATGLPGYESILIQGMFASGKIPVSIVTRLNREIELVLNQPEAKEKILNVGAEVTPSSPEQLAATVKADMVKLGKVIKDAGIRAD